MVKSAKDIGQNKWLKLSSRQKHTAICKYIRQCIDDSCNYKAFEAFYKKIKERGGIDVYSAPDWLNYREKLENHFIFHQKFSDKTIDYYLQEKLTKKVEWKHSIDVSVVLDFVITPFNIGAVLRVIDNFGLKELIYHNPVLDLNHNNLKRSARGVETWIPIRHEEHLYDFLKNTKKPVIGLEKTAESISIESWSPPDEHFYLVVGNEVYGISEKILELCDQVISISMSGNKHSMNLSHALAVVAYHLRGKILF
jgi:tRNA G18 (ribose-2'-O)-methylase SpoU